ncbi:hypothetical protein AHAS_Ahas02G0178400 [Arachis hypogaea]
MKGCITRAKEHLMIKLENVAGCKMVPKDVITELWEFYNQRKNRGKKCATPKNTEERSEDAQGIDEPHNLAPMAVARGGTTSMRGPMDLLEKLRHQNIKEACNKEAVRRVHQYIARWFYQVGIPLNPVKLKSFQDMLWAVENFGPNLPAPSYHALRIPLLNEELEYIKGFLKGHKE